MVCRCGFYLTAGGESGVMRWWIHGGVVVDMRGTSAEARFVLVWLPPSLLVPIEWTECDDMCPRTPRFGSCEGRALPAPNVDF